MNEIVLLPEKEIYLNILFLNIKFDIKKENFRKDFLQMTDPIDLPLIISDFRQKQIRNEFKEMKPSELSKVLSKHKISLIYIPTLLLFFYDNLEMIQTSFEISASYIFHLFMAWHTEFNMYDAKTSMPIFLNLFLFISSSADLNIQIHQKIRQISLSSFLLCYSDYISNFLINDDLTIQKESLKFSNNNENDIKIDNPIEQNYEVEEKTIEPNIHLNENIHPNENIYQSENLKSFRQFFDLLASFFSQNPDLPPSSLTILSDFIKAIVKSNESEVSILFQPLFTYIEIQAEEKSDRFPRNVAEIILSKITYSISNLDISAISLFSHLVPFVSENVALRVFGLLPRSIVSYIEGKPATQLSIKFKDNYQSILQQIDSSSATILQFVNCKAFENGLSFENFFKPMEPTDLESFMSNEAREILTMIKQSFCENKNYVEIFLNPFSIAITEYYSKNHCFDIMVAFLFICKEIFHLCDKKMIVDSLLSSPFFTPDLTFYSINNYSKHLINQTKESIVSGEDFFNDNSYHMPDAMSNEGIQFNSNNSNDNFIKEDDIAKTTDEERLIIDDFEKISALRSNIMSLVLSDGGIYIDIILQKWIRFPLLFAEIVNRVTQKVNILDIRNNTSLFSKTFMSILIYYQKLDFTITDKNDIEIARSSFFLFISQLLNVFRNSLSFFRNNFFVSTFLSFLFEPSLHQFIINHLFTFMSKCNGDMSPSLSSTLVQICHICTSSFPDKRSLILIIDLLTMANDLVIHQRLLSSFFSQWIDVLIPSFSSLDDSSLSCKLLTNFIEFLVLSCVKLPLKGEQVQSIENAIDLIFKDEVPPIILTKLIQIVAGECLSAIQPSFIIRQPKILKPFLKYSLKSENSIDSIKFIDKLCVFSISNCVTCHLSKFDIYIIEQIRNSQSEKLCEALLELFQHISMNISTFAVVHNFLSLFNPIHKQITKKKSIQYLPKNIKCFLNTLKTIVNATSILPISYLCMDTDETVIEVLNVNENDLNVGFTFVCWLYLDSSQPKYQPHILTITDSKKNQLIWFLSDNSLFCIQRKSPIETTGKIEYNFPQQKWFSLALRFKSQPDKGISIMNTYVNSQLVEELEYRSLEFVGNVTFIIGGINNLNKKTKTDSHQLHTILNQRNDDNDEVYAEIPARFGPFGLFPYLFDEILPNISDRGPRISGEIPLNPVFFFVPEESDGYLHIYEKIKKDEITVKSSQIENKASKTFTDILIQYCKVESLLSFLSYTDYTYENGQKFISFFISIIDLISTSLSLSEEAQESFYIVHGISIIAHFLKTIKSENIDYQLYLQFIKMYQSLSHKKLQTELMKEIILNLYVWLRCDADNHLRILRHISKVLINSIQTDIIQYINYSQIILSLSMFYWYDSEKACVILERTRGEELNVSECRQHLLQLALNVAQESFSVDDLNSLQGHCLNSSENRQTRDLLKHYKQLGSFSTNTVLKGLPEKVDLIGFMYNLLSCNDENVILEIIEIIVLFHRNDLITDSNINGHINCIVQKLSPTFVKKTFLSEMVNFMLNNQYYELFPVCCWSAISLGEQETLELFKKLTPSPMFCKHLAWSIWPIFASYKFNECVRSIIFDFLVNCSSSQWFSLYEMIHCVSFIFEVDAADSKAAFLRCIAEKLAVHQVTQKEVITFFLLSRLFILFRDSNESDCSGLSALFQKSPFYINHPPRNKSLIDQHQLNNHNFFTIENIDFEAKFFKMKIEHQSFKFGLRFNGDAEWIDKDLAMLVLSVLLLYKNPQFVNFQIILCAFLVHYSQDFVKSHIKRMGLTVLDFQMNHDAISLLEHHKNDPNHELVRNEIESNAFICLQRQKFNVDIEIPQKTQQMMNFLQEFNSKHKYTFHFADELISFSNEQLENRIRQLKESYKNQKRNWVRLSHNLECLKIKESNHNSPVNNQNSNNSKNVFHDSTHYSRDFTLCKYYCPFKVKRNWKFDNHKAAIVAREEGVVKRNDSNAIDYDLSTEIDYDINNLSSQIDYYIFPDKTQEKVNNRQKSLLNTLCIIINPLEEKKATFYLYKKNIVMDLESSKSITLKLSNIEHIFFRRRCHRSNSLELFTTNKKCYFIYFPMNDSLQIINKIASLKLPNAKSIQTCSFIQFFKQNSLTEQWINHNISNFEYLIHLNMMSGRSFNDISQYPIFPWILRDYYSEILDLENPESYRDLSKPIGVLGESRLNDILEISSTSEEPFLYGSGPLSALNVCLYLIRLEPFTTLHIQMQDGKFDHASRIFSSISQSFHRSTSSLNNYLELVPEFFFMPEFLVNSDHFDFGSSDNGIPVNDVILPPWAKSPLEFIYMNRKALESDYVSRKLPFWIDLIWGYKQRGEEAKFALNSFRPEMYDDAWSGSNIDETRKKQIETIQTHIGQIPPQLFFEPHLPKKNMDSIELNHFNNIQINLKNIYVIDSKSTLPVSAAFVYSDNEKCKISITILFNNASIVRYIMNFKDVKENIHTNFNPANSPIKSIEDNKSQNLADDANENKKMNEEVIHEVVSCDPIDISLLDGLKFESNTNQINGFAKIESDDFMFCLVNNKPSNNHKKLKIANKDMFKDKEKDSILYIVDKKCEKVIKFELATGKSEIINQLHVAHPSSIEWFDNYYLTVSDRDSVLNIYENNSLSNLKLSIPSYRDSIMCSCISHNYQVAVICTKNGSMIINSINKNTTTVVCDLECAKPMCITITDGWGFIIVFAVATSMKKTSNSMKNLKSSSHEKEKYLFLFNINGKLIRKTKININISHMHSWTTKKGFDYLAVADERGKVYAFEVFYLEIGNCLFRCNSPLIELKYFPDVSMIFVVTKYGTVYMIPFKEQM
ncbi:hypothetical protein TRFO_21723 [Tritrichomonas foetus]|uniref:BEACH domain-containing protein n=1 Tax=Tritrichomonas foetus TaxID=1144522 RepID=A0A1J4KI43_9EUKA|nr:hypothetical protein TRFO_21723 [Tritrichomonas foetus]|eukprot:OHT09334.1 hypothetical protein TRFO_21723 [Tritrichomonas foetus]